MSFLDLPKEVRFIVYEHLQPSKTRFTFTSLVLTTYTLPVQLLVTCRLIHAEAQIFLAPMLAEMRQHIPRIRIDAERLDNTAFDALGRVLNSLLVLLDDLDGLTLDDLAHLALLNNPPPISALRTWLRQTSTLLAIQSHSSPRPLLDFCADPHLGYARITVDVPKHWSALSKHPSATCVSSSAKMAELVSEVLDKARRNGVGCISAAVVFAQNKGSAGERLVCGLDFGVKKCKVLRM